MMVVDCRYNIGDPVFLRTDNDQNERLVTAIIVTPKGVCYELSFGTEVSTHYEFEIIPERDSVKATSN